MKLKIFAIILAILSSVNIETEAQQSLKNSEIVLPDSIGWLNKEVASLKERNNALKDLLKEEQQLVASKENKIYSLNDKIKQVESSYNERITQLEEKNIYLLKKMVSIASNFLYIPYEEYSINEIAIPAFKELEGSELFSKYNIRFELLKNYKSDIEMMIEFLTKADDIFKIPYAPIIEDEAKVQCLNFEKSSFCLNYKKYEDWEETYLGKKIRYINYILRNPVKDDQCQNKLKQLKSELESLIKPAEDEK